MNLYINKEKVMNALRELVYEIFIETFYWKKKLIFFITFYISDKSGIKSFLK